MKCAAICISFFAFGLHCSGQPSTWFERDAKTGAGLLGATYGPLNGQPIFLLAGEGRTIATSLDGANWASSSSGGTTYFDAASNGQGAFMLAGGEGYIAGIGVNGIDYAENILFSGIAYGNGTWSAVGGYFPPFPFLQWYNIYARTTNGGASWDEPIQTSSGTLQTPNGVAFGGGFGGNKFIAAMGSGAINMSFDGIVFGEVYNTGPAVHGAAFGNNIWITVGSSGRICRSIDGGFNWQCTTHGSLKTLAAVCYGGGYFVAVGQDALILYSTDGISWTTASSPPFPGRFLEAVTYGDGTWVASGEQGLVLQSSIKADLREFVPAGWSGSIVTGPTPGSNQSALVHVGDTVFVDFAFTNAGKATTPSSQLRLFIDNILLATYGVPSLTQNAVTGLFDLGITDIPIGPHTIKIVLDWTSVVNEFDEGNNVLLHTFNVASTCAGDLNGDQLVNDDDFVIFVFAYNILDCADPSMPAGCPSDLNYDEIVDDNDFVIFVAAYDALLCE